MNKVILSVILTFFSSFVWANEDPQFFGYWHQSPVGVKATLDHTNVVFIQAANPEQPLNEIAALHPTAKILFQFSALDLVFRGGNCNWNKCMEFNSDRVKEILDSVEQHVITPYQSRLVAFLIADEPETNPLTLDALQQLVNAIRLRPAFDPIPIWVNYNNVLPTYTKAEFFLTPGVDWISMTPSYGTEWNDLSPDFRYDFLLQRASQQNPKPKLVIVGDAWSELEGDSNFNGSLTKTGKIHLDKIEKQCDYISERADFYGISVVGVVPFSWSFPGSYTLGTSHESIKNKWRELAIRILGNTNSVPVEPIPPQVLTPTPAVPKCIP